MTEGTDPGVYPAPKRTNAWVVVGLGMLLASVALLVATGNTTVDVTEGSGASAGPLLGSLIPVALGLLVIRLLPWRFEAPVVLAGKGRSRVYRELLPAVGIAVALPALIFALIRLGANASLWAPALKTALFLVISGLLLRRFGGGEFALGGRPWLWPAAASVMYLTLINAGPFAPRFELPAEWRAPSVVPLLLGFSLVSNFVTAGLAEEIFYRALLQTRLEFLLGRWGGIFAASMLFAALHLPARYDQIWQGRTGSPALDFALALAAVVAFQGVFGLFVGYLWSRYRNLAVNVLMHTAVNVVPVFLIAADVL